MNLIKQSIASILVVCLLTLGALKVNAQTSTTLSQGDISIVGFSGVLSGGGVNSGFAFITWVDLVSGTQIRFTINTFNSSSSSSTASANANTTADNVLYWTANSAITAGTVISITGSGGTLSASTGIITIHAAGNGGNGAFTVSNLGRNLFAYQYGGTDDFSASSSPTATFNGSGLICGFVISGSGLNNNFLSSGSSSNKAGYLPSDLSATYCVYGLTTSSNVRSATYTGPTSGFATLAAAKASVNTHNGTNWITYLGNPSDNTVPTYPSNFTLPSSNTAPTFTNSSPQTLTVCEGRSATSINTLLTVSDADNSQTETWSVKTAPTHGTLGGFNATASSGSTSITPTGLTYTPTAGYSGSDQFIVQISDGTATANMTVNVTVTATPAITVNPSNSTICSGSNTSFGVTATGAGLTYQWQVSTDGGTNYADLTNTGIYTNVTTSTLNLTGVTTDLSGNLYRCIASGTCTPGATSTGATLTVNAAPAVTADPVASTICSGSNTSFSVTATGAGLTYQWKISTNGLTYNNLTNTGIYSNVTKSTLNLTNAKNVNNGYKYECVVSGTCTPSATSAVATLTVNAAPVVSTSPSNTTVCSGSDASFSVVATGGGLTYQWQVSTDGGTTFNDITDGGIYSNATTSTLNLTGVTSANSGSVYLCIVSGSCSPSTTSNGATLTVNATPVITVNPNNSAICSGSNTSFGITATGTGLTYKWQASTDGGNTFTNLNNVGIYTNTTTKTLNLTGATVSQNGFLYRCVVAGTCANDTSTAATLTINTAPAITVSPSDSAACAYTGAIFGVQATGSNLNYQWYVSTNGGNTYTILNSTGIYTNTSTDTLVITSPTTAQNGYLYRCVLNGTCGSAVTSSFATLTVTNCVNYWTGKSSIYWDNAANWAIGIPSNTLDAVIPAAPANQPTIAGGNRAALNVIVETGASLTNNGTLDVYGNFADSGSLISGSSSSVVMMGASGTISGTDTFTNLEIQGNYGIGASANDKIYVTGKLIKTSGTLSTSDKLTLISNASGSALIEENGGALTGKAYIQHYAGGNFGYHHFSSPISDGTVNSWSNAFPITGPDGAPSWLSNWGSLQIYDEVDNGFSILDSGYYNYTATSKALTLGKGYTAWLNSLPTLNTFGTPNNGAISIPVTHSTGTNAPKGWNFVGNPYPSPISWKALKTLNPGLFGDASCYLWKASGVATNGTWTAYDGTVGVNGAGDVINSSLGFFVYVTNSGTLNFNNTVRTYSYTNPEIFGTQSTAATSTLRISIKDEAARTTDEIVAYTSNQAGFSRKMAQPATATNATIAFDVNGTKAAINTLTAIDSKTELPITVLTPRTGTYAVGLSTKNISLPVYLKDAVTGTYTDLSANTTITTTTSETIGRYSLVFSKPLSIINYQLSIYPNPAKSNVVISGSHIASVQVVDNLGRVVKTVSLKDATNPTLSLGNLPAGAYHLRVQTTDGKVSGVGFVKE